MDNLSGEMREWSATAFCASGMVGERLRNTALSADCLRIARDFTLLASEPLYTAVFFIY
jgi:hypothetical protein